MNELDLDRMHKNEKILRDYEAGMEFLLRVNFPKCTFGLISAYDYKFIIQHTNTYEIRQFAKKYSFITKYLRGKIGHQETSTEFNLLTECVVVPNTIVLAKEYKDPDIMYDVLAKIVTLFKLKGII